MLLLSKKMQKKNTEGQKEKKKTVFDFTEEMVR